MTDIMSNTVQGSNILDVLKKKMRQTKEEMEKYKEDSEDMQKKLQVEIMRREEVSRSRKGQLSLFGWRSSNVQWHFLYFKLLVAQVLILIIQCWTVCHNSKEVISI